MKTNNPFKDWVPNWLVVFTLVFCMLHSMVLLGVYTSNVTYAASFLDVEPEDLQFSLSVTYGTFLATILVESRLFRYFPTKNYLMAIYALAALSFVWSVETSNFALFIFLRLLEGVLMALPWIPLRQLLISRFSSRNAIIIAFTCNYATLLFASPFIMNVAVWLLDHYDWSYMAYGSALLQLLCVGLIMLTFTHQRVHKKFPLYQIDWASYVLVLTAILSGAYVLIYGEKKYWFDSNAIVIGAFSAFVASVLFILRQENLKRPVFNIKVFRFRDLRIGFMLFIFFYIGRASLNQVHQAMYSIWNWEPMRVAHIQFLNVGGNVIGMALAALLLFQKVTSRSIFVFGFLVLALYHFWFTFLFAPDVSLEQIAIPYILQGVGVGVLLVPMVLYTVSSVPENLAPFSGTVGVAGRFWGSTIGFCLIQNLQVFLQRTHYLKLNRDLESGSSNFSARLDYFVQFFSDKGYTATDANRLAYKQINGSLLRQTTLLSYMEIFTFLGWFFVLIVGYLVFNKRFKTGFDLLRNRVWGS